MKLSMTSLIATTGLMLSLACQSNSETSHEATHVEPAAAAATQPSRNSAEHSKTPSGDTHEAKKYRATSKLAIGDTAPAKDVEMKNVDGQMVTIAKVAQKKGTLVVFTCNHCPFAKAWEGRIAALGNEFLSQEVGVIAINSNDPKKAPEDGFSAMQKRAHELGMKFPYVVDADSGMARAYGATKTPELFLFAGDGKLVYHGAVDDNSREPDKVESHYLRDALQALVAGHPIKQPVTKAVGCSIKLRAQS
ncbi:MAG: thioredoxin family protein [Myxococcales bacterium]|nr:thioredoxin family protein [Myxococcales bacterium]